MQQIHQIADEQLVEAFRGGNKQAFEQIVQRYQQKVYQLAYRLTGHPEDAADLAQDAFIKVFRNLGQFRGQSAFSTWLYRVVTNTFLDEVRRRKRRPVVAVFLDSTVATEDGEISRELPSDEDGPDELSLRKEVQETVQAALSSLPPDYRIILTLRDIQDHTYEEIAEILDLNLGTVKSRISRARLALRKLLSEQEQLAAASRQNK